MRSFLCFLLLLHFQKKIPILDNLFLSSILFSIHFTLSLFLIKGFCFCFFLKSHLYLRNFITKTVTWFCTNQGTLYLSIFIDDILIVLIQQYFSVISYFSFFCHLWQVIIPAFHCCMLLISLALAWVLTPYIAFISLMLLK